MIASERKLMLGLVAVLSVLCVGSAWVMAQSARRYYDELTQRLNAGIAMYIDREGQLIRNGTPDVAGLEQLARQAMVINPLARVYLLDPQGRIIAGGLGAVDLEPVQHFLEGAARGPVYGDDPAHPESQRVFSAHAVLDQGVAGYVYVVLGGSDTENLATTIASSHILKLGMVLLALLLGAISLLAVAIDRLVRRSRRNLESLRELDQARRMLFETIGHDLRAPLAAIRGHVEILERPMSDHRAPPSGFHAHGLHAIRQHCERLSRLVAQIFRLARLEAPTHQPRLEPVSVHELAQDIGARFQRDDAHGGHRLRLEIERETPLVLADCELLETVLENLVDNALRHSGPDARVTMSVCTRGNRVVVSVRDNGCGMDSELLSRLTVDAHYGPQRRGLGLLIVQRALRLLGSGLEINARPGEGTLMMFHVAVMNS